mmetsp:Transcript_5144/g.5100  ORF Transcript_5144/g.5100 Transcript_5144/m.5100 type:complete len:203 (+) Transcript_5144:13-621(+)
MSEFPKKTEKIKSLLRALESDSREYDRSSELFQKKVKARITKKLAELAIELDSLNAFLNSTTINQTELEKRKVTINELQKEYEKYDLKFNDHIVKIKSEEKPPAKTSPFEMQIQLKKDQDIMIDELYVSSENLHMYCDNIGEELDVHNNLLTNFEKMVDKNANSMERTKAKLEAYIQQTSNSCLGCVIFGLALVLVILLIYF